MGTRSVTYWLCRACGESQGGRRRVCQGCGRRKPPHPRGFGCCDRDHAITESACPLCGGRFDPMDAAKLPHPEHIYTTEE